MLVVKSSISDALSLGDRSMTLTREGSKKKEKVVLAVQLGFDCDFPTLDTSSIGYIDLHTPRLVPTVWEGKVFFRTNVLEPSVLSQCDEFGIVPLLDLDACRVGGLRDLYKLAQHYPTLRFIGGGEWLRVEGVKFGREDVDLDKTPGVWGEDGLYGLNREVGVWSDIADLVEFKTVKRKAPSGGGVKRPKRVSTKTDGSQPTKAKPVAKASVSLEDKARANAERFGISQKDEF